MRIALPAFVGFACLLLIVPIAIVVVFGFSGGTYLRFPPESLSWRWSGAFLGDERWRQALWSSLAIGAIACVVATSVGFFAAYALVRGNFPGRASVRVRPAS